MQNVKEKPPESGYEDIYEFEIQEFIQVGGQSIVFKGIKKTVGRTYALKFRPISFYEEFNDYELEYYKLLERSSVSKIAGLILEVPFSAMSKVFDMIPEDIRKDMSFQPNEDYFCIIEDYIQGCNLKEYCHGSRSRGLPAHCPPKDADHKQVLEYQRMIFDWIIQLCDIMSNVTDEKRIIHLDIKPENIMITDDTKSLVLVDFGAARELGDMDSYDLTEIEFGVENQGNFSLIGTPYYAAPEAYNAEAKDKPPLGSRGKTMYGHVDQRSDIFSFGATIWNCIIPDTRIQANLRYNQYYNRDLFAAPKGYIKELEDIITTCTAEEPVSRYKSFKELKAAAVEARKKMPSEYKAKRARRGFLGAAIISFVIGLAFLGISARSGKLTYQIADYNFTKVETDYTEKDAKSLLEYAETLIKADRNNKGNYDRIYDLVSKEKITKDEANVLISVLKYTKDKDTINKYLEGIMTLSDSSDNIFSLVNDINKSIGDNSESDNNGASDKNDAVKLVYYVINNYNDNEKSAAETVPKMYEVLKSFFSNNKNMKLYAVSLLQIIHVLDMKENKALLAEAEGVSPDEIGSKLEEMKKKLTLSTKSNADSSSGGGKQ